MDLKREDEARFPTGHDPDIGADATSAELRARGDLTRAASDDKRTVEQFPELTDDEVSRVPLLQPGANLDQGSVYLDLDDPERGPFTASGNEAVRPGDRYVSKRDAEHEIWRRITRGR
jgi:hypothetical protein